MRICVSVNTEEIVRSPKNPRRGITNLGEESKNSWKETLSCVEVLDIEYDDVYCDDLQQEDTAILFSHERLCDAA